MSEELYPLKGYEGKYSITKSGKVYSHTRKKGFLKTYTQKNRYEIVTISGKSFSVHRLVMLTFMPIPFDDAQVNHINGNKRDNRIENLEWVSAKENTNHAIGNGLRKKPFYTSFTDEVAKSIKERIANGERQIHIAKEYGVTKWVINSLARGRTYSNV